MRVLTAIMLLVMTSSAHTLPKTYDSFVLKLRSSDDPRPLVSMLLDTAVEHYDVKRNFGTIAPTAQGAYALLSKSSSAPVHNAICGSIHQLAADALHSAGYQARVSQSVGAAGTNHNTLVWRNGNRWTLNNYGSSTSIMTNADIVSATESLTVGSPLVLHVGTLIMYDDGEHTAYSRLAIGRLLPVDVDKNAHNNLTSNDKENSIEVGATSGIDKLFGSYSAIQGGGHRTVGKNFDAWRLLAVVGGHLSYLYYDTQVQQAHNTTLGLDASLKVLRAIADYVSFMSEIEQRYVVNAVIGHTGKDTGKGAYSEYSQTYQAGVEYDTDGLRVRAFVGLRLESSLSLYSVIPSLLPAILSGVEFEGSAPIGSTKLSTSWSLVGVEAIGYKMISTKASVSESWSVTESVDMSVTLSSTGQLTQIDGFEKAHKEAQADGTISVSYGNIELSVGVCVQDAPYIKINLNM